MTSCRGGDWYSNLFSKPIVTQFHKHLCVLVWTGVNYQGTKNLFLSQHYIVHSSTKGMVCDAFCEFINTDLAFFPSYCVHYRIIIDRHISGVFGIFHDEVMEWKHFPCNWPFVWGIHWSPVDSPHKGQWRVALMFSLICAWTTVEQTIDTLVIWDAIGLIMTSS